MSDLTTDEILVDSIWQDVDSRMTRFVRIVAICSDGRIMTRRCDENGNYIVMTPYRKSDKKRFNGRSGGYRFVKNPPKPVQNPW